MDAKSDISQFNEAISALGESMGYLTALPDNIRSTVGEVRIRCGREVMLTLISGEIIGAGGGIISPQSLREMMLCLCGHAVYSHQEEIARGYITTAGGHRAGLCGTAVITDGRITALRDISSINLRIARQVKGCGDECISALFSDGVTGCIIAGAPCSGKTTILRDMALALSEGRFCSAQRVVLVDERGELAAMHGGLPRFDIGPCCDVLDSFPKSDGILHALRCLSPDVIICDEVGGQWDCLAIEQGTNAGVKMIVSVHAGSVDELCRRPQIKALLSTGAFEKIALLSSNPRAGTLREIVNVGDIL